MKLALSYFYQIRHLKPNMIPISTAVFDPKWFHDFTFDNNFTFFDKRGIINGLRCEDFHNDEHCSGLCQGAKNCEDTPEQCLFLKTYRAALEKIDINSFLQRCETVAQKVQKVTHFEEEPIIVLIVYETPSNPCSERQPLLDYFNSHGIECKELQYPIK